MKESRSRSVCLSTALRDPHLPFVYIYVLYICIEGASHIDMHMAGACNLSIHEQNRCSPIVVMMGREKIHLFVLLTGL